MSNVTESWSLHNPNFGWGNRSRISFGAVFAGALVAVATWLLFSLLGAAFGTSGVISSMLGSSLIPGNVSGALGDASVYGGVYGTGGWTIVSLIAAMLLGGYVASRLSGTHSHLDGELHGITMWGLAVMLSLLAVAAVRGPGPVGLGGEMSAVEPGINAFTGTTSATGAAFQPSAIAQFQGLLGGGTDPTTMSRQQISDEVSTLLGRDLGTTGAIAEADRDRLIALISAQYGLTRDQAIQRLTSVENVAKQRLARIDEDRRAQAATIAQAGTDAARALFTSLTLGLLAALVGSWLGTRHKRILHPHEALVPAASYVHTQAASYAPAQPIGVSIYDDTWHLVSQYLRGASFPMSKQELLRYAQASHASTPIIQDIERLADRNYANANEVLTAIGAM